MHALPLEMIVQDAHTSGVNVWLYAVWSHWYLRVCVCVCSNTFWCHTRLINGTTVAIIGQGLRGWMHLGNCV